MFNRDSFKRIDFILLLSVLAIFALGLVFLYSATCQYSARFAKVFPANFVLRQIIWFILGGLIGLAIIKIDYQKWIELAYPLYGLNLALLLLVLFKGQVRFGAQRWLSFGSISFQPAEFSKLVIILVLARYLGQKQMSFARTTGFNGGIRHPQALAFSLLLVIVPFMLIVKQPDLGTALTLVPILFACLYVRGFSLRSLLLIIAPCLVASPILWHLLKDYQKRRILVFINPDMDPLGAGYTIIQSKIAIGSGGLFGKGWLSGTQSQLNFLPERHTDFIFSVVGEEGGFLGAALLLTLYFILIWRAFSCAQRTTSFSGRLLACGITTLLAFQIVINIAMTMGLVPVVGLPLPLITYGGSSLLTTMVCIALLLNVGMRS